MKRKIYARLHRRRWLKKKLLSDPNYNKNRAASYAERHPLERRLSVFNATYGCKISAEDLKAKFFMQKNTCPGCGASLSLGWQIDHIVAHVASGDSSIGNLQLLCKQCNIAKHSFSWAEFVAHARRICAHQDSPRW